MIDEDLHSLSRFTGFAKHGRESSAPKKRKGNVVTILSLAELLVMSVWFSASAVVPVLGVEWKLTPAGESWLTMAVQIGFVLGALGSAVLNALDRVDCVRLFGFCSFASAAATAAIPAFVNSLLPALLLRIVTGICLAGVYPVGMKIVASWTGKDRGLGIGVLVGALTVGSATPHLLNFFWGTIDWHWVMYVAAVLALFGGLIVLIHVSEGPLATAGPAFNRRHIGRIIRQRDVMLANLGYFGHMWELYAMWAWIPVFVLHSFRESRTPTAWASLLSFTVIAVGGVGSVMAGWLADRWGRTKTTILAMAVSGACAVLVGLFFGGNPLLLGAVCLVWGFTVVADSAQFSAAVSELSESDWIGTSLTLQTSLGFLLTMVSIRLVPVIRARVGWRLAFAFLAIGPFLGIWAMAALRRRPESARLAQGRR